MKPFGLSLKRGKSPSWRREMREILALALCAALSGCVHNLRDCPEPDYAGFARDMDEISLMRRNGLINEDMATQLFAMEAIALRTAQLACKSED